MFNEILTVTDFGSVLPKISTNPLLVGSAPGWNYKEAQRYYAEDLTPFVDPSPEEELAIQAFYEGWYVAAGGVSGGAVSLRKGWTNYDEMRLFLRSFLRESGEDPDECSATAVFYGWKREPLAFCAPQNPVLGEALSKSVLNTVCLFKDEQRYPRVTTTKKVLSCLTPGRWYLLHYFGKAR